MDEYQKVKSNKFPDRMECEQQLLEYQKRIGNILESFTDAFFEVDSNWVVTYWNKEAEKILLMPRKEIIGKNLWEMYEDAIPLKFFTEYHQAMRENVSRRFEEYFSPKKIWLEVAVFPSGQGLSIYFKDITERKNATKKLNEERKKYSDLFNLSPVPQWVYDAETLRFIDVNEAAINHYGYSRQEFMEMTIRNIHFVEEDELLDEVRCTSISTNVLNNTTVRHQKKNEDIIHVCIEENIVYYGDRKAHLMMVIDRTVEIEAQTALEESEKRFRTLVQNGSDMIAILDAKGTYKYVSQTTKTILGIDAEDFIGANAFDFIHPDDKLMASRIYNRLEYQEQAILKPFRFKAKNGEFRWVETILLNMLNDPAVEGVVANSRDITQRIENELKTERSINRFNIVSKATSDAIWDWDMLTNEVVWNQGIKGIFGHKKTGYTNLWWRSQVHPEDLDGVLKKFNNLIINQKTRLKAQYRFRCADGAFRFVLDRAFITFNADGLPIRMIGSMQDITEQMHHVKAIEQQNCLLQEISWIQSHKIRSPLATILGLVELIGVDGVHLSEIRELIPLLKHSAGELDDVLREIIGKIS